MICEMIDLSPVVSFSQQFRDEVLLGLLKARKSIPPKFFYDRKGSELFDRICELPEYYPTRVETAILSANMREISELLGNQVTLVEFGSGASRKTRLLLDELADPCAYVPIDISRDFLLESSRALSRDYRGLPVIPVYADYTRALSRLERELADYTRKVAFFPGSTVGNMEPLHVQVFLRECARFLGASGKMLIGFDLIKSIPKLEAAYNDSEGVTAAFNLNLLSRMNRELGATFDLSRFRHHAYFNRTERRVEMHLVSTEDQEVEVVGRRVRFGEEESIHTESSYKYTIEDFSRLCEMSYFAPLRFWTDESEQFAVALLEARNIVRKADALPPLTPSPTDDWRWAS